MTVENTQAVDQSGISASFESGKRRRLSSNAGAAVFKYSGRRFKLNMATPFRNLLNSMGRRLTRSFKQIIFAIRTSFWPGRISLSPAEGQSVQAVSQAQTVESTGSSSSSESKVSAVGTGGGFC